MFGINDLYFDCIYLVFYVKISPINFGIYELANFAVASLVYLSLRVQYTGMRGPFAKT